MEKVLISGIGSGIGKYLHEKHGGLGLSRYNTTEVFSHAKDGVDTIIHCAFNAKRDVTSDTLNSYSADNIGLTNKLLEIPHKKFIFFSTVDVYPRDSEIHYEEEDIALDAVNGLYPLTKLMSESSIRRVSQNFLILRCTGLLGLYSRKNNLLKVLQDPEPHLSLTPESEVNVVLHEYLNRFIIDALSHDYQGIYNIAASSNVTIKEVAELAQKNVQYGTFAYRVARVDTRKVQDINGLFKRSSLENIREFSQQLS